MPSSKILKEKNIRPTSKQFPKYRIIWAYTYKFQPLMVCFCYIGPPPSVKVKDIHAIQPHTTILNKVGWNDRVWKIEVILVFSSRAAVFTAPWIDNCTNNISIEIQFPQRRYVMLYYSIILQEHYLVEIWKQLCGQWKLDYIITNSHSMSSIPSGSICERNRMITSGIYIRRRFMRERLLGLKASRYLLCSSSYSKPCSFKFL